MNALTHGLLRTGWLVLVAVVVLGASRTQAVDSKWTAADGGVFNDPANWSAGVPGAADKAIFDLASAYTVSWSGSATNANASVNKTGCDVTVSPGPHTWRVTNAFWVAENAANSGMRLASGRLTVDKAMDVGYGRTGTLIVTNGASLEVGGNLRVGNNALGTTLVVAGAGSKVTVGGVLDTMMGNSRSNLLMVADGGSLLLTAPIPSGYIGSYNSASAWGNRMIVDGAGSSLEVGNYLYFRNMGTRFTVSNRGRVTVTNATFAIAPDSNYGARSNLFEVAGAGSRMDVKSFIFGTYNSLAKRADNDNQCRVVDGGLFTVIQNITMGGTNNQIVAAGPGSIIQSSELHIQTEADTVVPAVVISGGALLTNQALGLLSGDLIVTGAGSRYGKGVGGCAIAGQPIRPPARLLIADGGLAAFPADSNYVSIGSGNSGHAGHVEVSGVGARMEAPGSRGILVGEWGSGSLTVRGGGAVTTGQLKLGLQITATNSLFDLDGADSRVTVAGGCFLTRGTMRFTADEQGFGLLEVGSTLTVTGGAKLEIDATRLRPREGTFTLATHASRSGAFLADDITIINGFGQVTQTATSLSVRLYPQGSALILR